MSKSSNRIPILLGLFAVSIGIGILYLLTAGPGTASEQSVDYARDLEISAEDPTLSKESSDPGGMHSIDFEELLDDYLAWAQYPPDSRPLKPEHVDVLEYHWISVPAAPMLITKSDGSVESIGVVCRLQPARSNITENEAMIIALYCQDSETEGMSTIENLSHTLAHTMDDRRRTIPADRISVNDQGKSGDEHAGDRIYTFQFTPTRNDWGDMFLETTFKIAGRPNDETHTLETHFFSTPTAPAKFTGNFREGVRDGSLVISVEMLVESAGRYTIEGNLFQADPELTAGTEAIGTETEEIPVGYARADARLGRGLQWVDLTYFGKVLHDQNQAGPYVLRGVRGTQDTGPIDPQRLDGSPEEVEAYLETIYQDKPGRKQLPYWTGRFVTRPYALDEFSRAEYNSPEKQERIKTIKGFIAGQ